MNLMKEKWIVFDAMGVIFKVGDDTGMLLIPMLKKLYPSLTEEHIRSVYIEASLGNISAFEFWKAVGMKNDYLKIQNAYLDKFLALDENFKTAAEGLSKNFNIAMLSNDVGEWSQYLREKHGLNGYFDEVIISSYVRCRKPSRDIFEILLKRTGAEPQNCLFIDDSEANLKAAAQLGINTILFSRDGKENYDGLTAKTFDELQNVISKVFA